MKKIRGLLVLLLSAFGLTLSSPNVFALSFTNYFNLPAYGCSTSTFAESLLKYSSVWIFSKSNISNYSNYDTLVLTNSTPNYRFNVDCSYQWGRPWWVSFLKPTKESNQMTIWLYNYNWWYDNVVLPKSWYTHTMKNGETVVFDNIYLWHWFFVLYTSWYTHTLQFFHDYYLEDYIIFTDPLESSLQNSSLDNFYVISFPKLKAWWMKLLEMHIDPIFKWNLDNYSISQFPFTSSYTLTQSNSNSPFPVFSSYMSASVSNWSNLNWERFKNDVWFIYQKDLDFVSPDFWWSEDEEESTWSYVSSDLTAWNNWNSCTNDYSHRNFVVQNRIACRSDYQNWVQDLTWYNAVSSFIQSANIYNENLTWEIESYFAWIELTNSCQWLLNNAVHLSKLYNNYLDRDFEYYSDVINELKYIRSENPYSLETYCWSKPTLPTELWWITNNSNVCNMESWANIVNCFQFWSSTTSNDTWSNTYFWQTVDNIRWLIQWAFDSEFLSPIVDNYNQWKSVIQYGVSCDVNNNLLKIPYIDYVVWLLAILIFFLLFWML